MIKGIKEVATESGRYYKINEKNQIIRTDMPFTPSDSWKLVDFIDRYDRTVEPKHGECRYKNGRGKFWLVDYDHGTYSVWGDRIVEVWYREEK